MNYLKALLVSAIAVLAPVKALIYIISLLILSDTVTGIIAAYKRGEEINSKGMKKTIIKLFLYNLVIVLAFLIERYILESIVPFVKVGALTIALTEFKSVIENFESITGIKLLHIKKVIENQTNQKKEGEKNG